MARGLAHSRVKKPRNGLLKRNRLRLLSASKTVMRPFGASRVRIDAALGEGIAGTLGIYNAEIDALD